MASLDDIEPGGKLFGVIPARSERTVAFVAAVTGVLVAILYFRSRTATATTATTAAATTESTSTGVALPTVDTTLTNALQNALQQMQTDATDEASSLSLNMSVSGQKVAGTSTSNSGGGSSGFSFLGLFSTGGGSSSSTSNSNQAGQEISTTDTVQATGSSSFLLQLAGYVSNLAQTVVAAVANLSTANPTSTTTPSDLVDVSTGEPLAPGVAASSGAPAVSTSASSTSTPAPAAPTKPVGAPFQGPFAAPLELFANSVRM